MKFDKGLMAGSSTLLVLSLLEGGDMYGYQMIEELSRRSNDPLQMKEGNDSIQVSHLLRSRRKC